MSLGRNLAEARLAFQNGNIDALIRAHDLSSYEEEGDEQWCQSKIHDEYHPNQGQYLRAVVYGAMDGIITTFSVVMAANGAHLNTFIVIILGIANLLGDGISMGLGQYLSMKSQQEYYQLQRQREVQEIEFCPPKQKRDLYNIYVNSGVNKKNAKEMVELITKNKQVWAEIMMVEEQGLIKVTKDPIKQGIATFIAFCLFGFAPLIPYIISYLFQLKLTYHLIYSIISSILSLFILGCMKGKFTSRLWYNAGIETVTIGIIAGIASFLIGKFFEHPSQSTLDSSFGQFIYQNKIFSDEI